MIPNQAEPGWGSAGVFTTMNNNGALQGENREGAGCSFRCYIYSRLRNLKKIGDFNLQKGGIVRKQFGSDAWNL